MNCTKCGNHIDESKHFSVEVDHNKETRFTCDKCEANMITTRDIVIKTGLCIPTILMAIRYLFGDHKVVKGKVTSLTVQEANQVLGHLRFRGNVELFHEGEA